MDVYSILGQVNIAVGNTFENLYTGPVPDEVTYDSPSISVTSSAIVGNSQTSVTSIIVCNTGAADDFSIRLVPDSVVTATLAQYKLFENMAIGANTTIVLSLGLVMSAGNLLDVTCATTGRVSFTAMGVVIT